MLSDFKLKYLEGVCHWQISIRGQNTKNKAGTLPLYAYITDSPEASPLDFSEVYLQDCDNTESNNRPVIFETGSVVLIQATGFLSDIVLGRFIKDMYAGESEATVQIYHNDNWQPTGTACCPLLKRTSKYMMYCKK